MTRSASRRFGLSPYVGAAPGEPFEVSEWGTRGHALGREA